MSAEDWHGECHAVGMNGDCGNLCPVFARGECENVDLEEITIENLIDDFGKEDAEEIIQMYKDRDDSDRRDRFNNAQEKLNKLLER